jgi:hypothetical protein
VAPGVPTMFTFANSMFSHPLAPPKVNAATDSTTRFQHALMETSVGHDASIVYAYVVVYGRCNRRPK